MEAADDFALEVVDTEALAEAVNAVPATEGALESFGELADEADGFVYNNRGDNGKNDAEGGDNNNISKDGGEGGIFLVFVFLAAFAFFSMSKAANTAGEGLDRDGEEDGDADND